MLKTDVKKTEIVDTTITDSEKVDSEGQLKAKIDRLKNLPEEAKEIMRERMMDDEVKRIEDERIVETLKSENTELKEGLENAKKVESKLAAMENALKEKIEELTVKDATKLDKFNKFITNPKVKLAIGIGLIGVASVATGGGALVGAWLHLPYGLGISALGGTSNLTTALLGSGLVGMAYGDKIKNGLRENMKEILGIIKNEEKIKNTDNKQQSTGETAVKVKGEELRGTEKKTEKKEDKKENFLNKFLRKIVVKKEFPGDGQLIKKLERIKKSTVPERETGEVKAKEKPWLKKTLFERAEGEDGNFNVNIYQLLIEMGVNEEKLQKDLKEYLKAKENPDGYKINLINYAFDAISKSENDIKSRHNKYKGAIKEDVLRIIKFLYPKKNEEEIKKFCGQSIRNEIYQLLYPESKEKPV